MVSYKTKKINGYDAVHIKDIPLKYGRISSQNSMPYISLNYVQKLQDLDKQMGATGNRYKITSNIGGSHTGGPRSHSNFQKMDIAPDDKAGYTSFNQAGRNYLQNNWVGNGAIGNEGNHWDLSFSPHGGPNNAKGGNLQNNPLRPAPGMLNPAGQIMNLYNNGLLTNAQMYDLMKKQQEELAAKYDVGKARNESAQRIGEETQNAIPQINEQMMQNIDDPIVFQHADQHSQLNRNMMRDQANRDLTLAQLEYYNQRNPQQMADDYDTRVQKFLDTMNAGNPYNQANTQGQIDPYHLDEKAIRRAAMTDQFHKTAMQNLAMTAMSEGNPQAANLYNSIANDNHNLENYLRNAQLSYQAQVANQLGLPPEVIQEQMKHNNKMAEAMAPGASSAYKEASILQPNQNLRTYMTEVPEQATKLYNITSTDEDNRMNDLLQRNKLYQQLNLPGANAMVNSLGDVTGMEAKYPQQTLSKLEALSGNISKPNQSMIQGNTAITGNAMKEYQDATQNINNNLMNAYEEQGKDYRKAIDVANQGTTKTRAEERSDALKEAKEKQTYVNSVLSQLKDIATGYPAKGTEEQFMRLLKGTGKFSDEEIADVIQMYYR